MSQTKIVIVDEHDPQNYGNQVWHTEPGELMCYGTGDGLRDPQIPLKTFLLSVSEPIYGFKSALDRSKTNIFTFEDEHGMKTNIAANYGSTYSISKPVLLHNLIESADEHDLILSRGNRYQTIVLLAIKLYTDEMVNIIQLLDGAVRFRIIRPAKPAMPLKTIQADTTEETSTDTASCPPGRSQHVPRPETGMLSLRQ